MSFRFLCPFCSTEYHFECNGWTTINGTFSVLHISLVLFSIEGKPFPIDRFHVKLPTKRRYFFILNMLHHSVTCDVTDWSKQHNLRQQHFSESSYCIFSIFDHRYFQCHSISTHLIALVTMEFVKVMYWNRVTLKITTIGESNMQQNSSKQHFFESCAVWINQLHRMSQSSAIYLR